jgi:hypothetical protein
VKNVKKKISHKKMPRSQKWRTRTFHPKKKQKKREFREKGFFLSLHINNLRRESECRRWQEKEKKD